MRVRFVGSGDAFGSGGRLQTCILLETEGEPITLVDCGASSLIGLKGAGVDPNRIATVLVSHLHGDHFGGVPFLVLDGQFAGRRDALEVAGPPGLEARVTAAMEIFFPGSSRARRRFEVRFTELPEGARARVGRVAVTPYEVDHACGAPPYALRIETAGRVITYSGDTAWVDRLVTAAAGADLFICEAYFYDKRVPFHLDFETLMAHRAALDCRRIVLTHMSADMLSRVPDLAGTGIDAAYDGLEIEL